MEVDREALSLCQKVDVVKGWRSLASELRLALLFFFLESSHGGGLARRRNGNRLSLGLGGSESVPLLKSPVEEVGIRSYVEVLEGPRKLSTSSSPLRGIIGNYVVSASMGQSVTGQVASGFAFRGY